MKGKKGSSSGAAHGETTGSVDPSVVRFTHSRISPVFTGCGLPLEQTLADIVDGRTKIEDLPLITVIPLEDGTFCSMNNRRLWVLKQLRERGLVPNNRIAVKIRVQSDSRRLKDKFTPERCSLTARFFKLTVSKEGRAEQENEEESSSSEEDEEEKEKHETKSKAKVEPKPVSDDESEEARKTVGKKKKPAPSRETMGKSVPFHGAHQELQGDRDENDDEDDLDVMNRVRSKGKKKR